MSPPRPTERKGAGFKRNSAWMSEQGNTTRPASGSKPGKKGGANKTGLAPCVFRRKIVAKWNLQAHMKTHTKEKPHICGACGKEFADKRSLNGHIVIHLPEDRRPIFECKLCKIHLSSKRNLMYHEHQHKMIELNISHDCEICGKQFLTVFCLGEHVRTHTGELPFKCSYCHKSFSTDGNRCRHENIHTRHKLYTCSICQREFTQSAALKGHLMIHNNEAPHQCLFCDLRFTYKPALYNHLRVHTKERPYFCKSCGFTASHSSNITSHMIR